MNRKAIVVIGAGPIGLEAALYARRLGHRVDLFERGDVGDNMRRWGFVRMFSSARMNRSALAQRTLLDAGHALPADDAYLTGAEHVESILLPLSRHPSLAPHVHPHHRVVQVGRARIGKGLPLGVDRADHPFRLLLERPDGERIVEADVVLDCTGTYGNARGLGSGNLPAVGERDAADHIAYTLQDILGSARGRFEGRRVLLVGAGHSASTALDGLAALPGTRVVWVTRGGANPPCPRIPHDPLPERDRLSARANELVEAGGEAVRFLPATEVDRVVPTATGIEVTLRRSGGIEQRVVVDTVLAHVGYHPDSTLYRELQVHECYATSGPMKLAATLLAGDSEDCLAQASPGPEALINPEPDFYILGAKSYGRNSQFLIRSGLEQVRDAFALIEQRPELNLYAA